MFLSCHYCVTSFVMLIPVWRLRMVMFAPAATGAESRSSRILRSWQGSSQTSTSRSLVPVTANKSSLRKRKYLWFLLPKTSGFFLGFCLPIQSTHLNGQSSVVSRASEPIRVPVQTCLSAKDPVPSETIATVHGWEFSGFTPAMSWERRRTWKRDLVLKYHTCRTEQTMQPEYLRCLATLVWWEGLHTACLKYSNSCMAERQKLEFAIN